MKAAGVAVAIAVAVAIMAFANAARAEPTARFVYLRGKGTETCPTEDAIRSGVQTRLGYDPFNSYASSTMFVDVTVPRSDGAFAASLKLVDADNAVRGERLLVTTGACSELMEAMALTISLAIDPLALTRSGPPPGAPPDERHVDLARPEPEPADSESDEAPPPPPSEPAAPRPPSRRSYWLSLGAFGTTGSEPALAMGVAATGEIGIGHFVGGLEGRIDLPASASAGGLGRVKASLAAGSVLGGVRFGPVFGEAVVTVGQVDATSTGTAESRDERALYLGAGGRIGGALPLGDRFEIRLRAELLANLDRHTLTISGEQVYQYPVVAGNLGLFFALRFD